MNGAAARMGRQMARRSSHLPYGPVDLLTRFISLPMEYGYGRDKNVGLKPGQEFVNKRKNTIYIIKSIRDKTVVLVSEKGEVSMLIQKDSLLSTGSGPLYD